MTELFNEHQRAIVWFCAKECQLQMSGELSVAWMLDAYEYALGHLERQPDMSDVIRLGGLVEPQVNFEGFRTVGVRVGNDVKMHHTQVYGAMVDLLHGPLIKAPDPEGFFYQYETIHPFRDGNGRTGVILYNWLRGSLLVDPVWPPNFWDDPRRVGLRTAE